MDRPAIPHDESASFESRNIGFRGNFLLMSTLPITKLLFLIAAVVPVAAATMTPVPLLIAYVVKKVAERCCINGKKEALAAENPADKAELGGIIKATASKRSGAGEEVRGSESKQLLLKGPDQDGEEQGSGSSADEELKANGHLSSKGENASMA